jgi:hypothetical protein
MGLDAFNGREVDVAVTMGCGDERPLVRAGRRVDWKIPDPRDMTPEEFRGVRDLLGQKVRDLLAGPLLGSADLPVEIEYEEGVISQYPIGGVEVTPSGLLFHLGTEHTPCLAPEKCKVGDTDCR